MSKIIAPFGRAKVVTITTMEKFSRRNENGKLNWHFANQLFTVADQQIADPKKVEKPNGSPSMCERRSLWWLFP